MIVKFKKPLGFATESDQANHQILVQLQFTHNNTEMIKNEFQYEMKFPTMATGIPHESRRIVKLKQQFT
jgi:hypothetical protein